MEEIIDTYGYYYEDVVSEQEDLAYKKVANRNPIKKARSKIRKVVKEVGHTNTTTSSTKDQVVDTSVKHHTKGLKLRKRNITVSYS